MFAFFPPSDGGVRGGKCSYHIPKKERFLHDNHCFMRGLLLLYCVGANHRHLFLSSCHWLACCLVAWLGLSLTCLLFMGSAMRGRCCTVAVPVAGAGRIELIERLTSDPSRRCGVGDQFSYGYLGFGASPDGKSIFYLTGGRWFAHACISHSVPALELKTARRKGFSFARNTLVTRGVVLGSW